MASVQVTDTRTGKPVDVVLDKIVKIACLDDDMWVIHHLDREGSNTTVTKADRDKVVAANNQDAGSINQLLDYIARAISSNGSQLGSSLEMVANAIHGINR